MEGGYGRKKRIQRLKKIILGTIVAGILIPIVLCIILTVQVISLTNRVGELEDALLGLGEAAEDMSLGAAEPDESEGDGDEDAWPDDETQQESGGEMKQIYLTFDDGPSGNTDEILDILKEYNVKATFFVLAKTDEQSVRSYLRIVKEGHTLGMHSYSHKYDEIYASKENFVEDVTKLRDYLEDITGVRPKFYRFPGGSSNTVSEVDMQELIDYLDENGITYFDWNIASGDAVSEKLSVETIVENCTSRLDRINVGMILMHDANDKITTVEALPEVIRKIQDRGDAVFLPVTDDTKPVQHIITAK